MRGGANIDPLPTIGYGRIAEATGWGLKRRIKEMDQKTKSKKTENYHLTL